MRRGLMDWEACEVPAEQLKARVQQVAAECRAKGLVAMVFHANFTRPTDIAALTHFVPFWSQCLLAVSATGETLLSMATTGRTIQLIRKSSVLDHVTVGRPIGSLLSEWLATLPRAESIAQYGLVRPDDMPQSVLAQFHTGLPEFKTLDCSDWWQSFLDGLETPEILRMQAQRLSRAAFEAIAQARHTDANSVVAVADGTCRRMGAEEVSVLIDPSLADRLQLRRLEGDCPLGARVAVQVSVAYKGHWIRQSATFTHRAGTLVCVDACTSAEQSWGQLWSQHPTPDAVAQALAQQLQLPAVQWLLEAPERGLPLNTIADSKVEWSERGDWPKEGSFSISFESADGVVAWGAPIPSTPTSTLSRATL